MSEMSEENKTLIQEVYHAVLVPEGWHVEAANHPGEWEVSHVFHGKDHVKHRSEEAAMLACWESRCKDMFGEDWRETL